MRNYNLLKMNMEKKYFCASTIINKCGLLHTININYMGVDGP